MYFNCNLKHFIIFFIPLLRWQIRVIPPKILISSLFNIIFCYYSFTVFFIYLLLATMCVRIMRWTKWFKFPCPCVNMTLTYLCSFPIHFTTSCLVYRTESLWNALDLISSPAHMLSFPHKSCCLAVCSSRLTLTNISCSHTSAFQPLQHLF